MKNLLQWYMESDFVIIIEMMLGNRDAINMLRRIFFIELDSIYIAAAHYSRLDFGCWIKGYSAIAKP